MPLRTAIRIKEDLINLTDSIKAVLSVKAVQSLAASTIQDESVKSTLMSTTSSNGETITTQQVELIAAEMLGFDSALDMNNHYNDITLYSSDRYEHSHPKGEGSYNAWTKEGVCLTIADLIGFGIIEASQAVYDERIECTGDISTYHLRSEIPEFEHIIENNDVAATMFLPIDKGFYIGAPKYQGVLFDNPWSTIDDFENYIETLRVIYEEADEGGYFCVDNTFLKELESQNIEYPIATQEDFASMTSLLQWVVAAFAMGNPVDLKEGHKDTKGLLKLTSTDLDGELDLIYHIKRRVFAVVHDGTLIKSLGFTTTEEDIRMTAYEALLK